MPFSVYGYFCLMRIHLERWLGQRSVPYLLLVIGLYYGAISFVNHYTFRTSADPLGIYTNALYDYSHFRANDCTLIIPNRELDGRDKFFTNKLSDHFTISQMLFAPFIWLTGSWTLLIVQFLALLLGVYGVYVYFVRYGAGHWFAVLAMLHYAALFGIHSALAFDFHDNVMGAALIPWLIIWLRTGQWLKLILLFAFIIGSKESLSIVMFSISAVLFLFPYEKKRSQRLAAGIMGFASIVYFVAITKFVIPSLANVEREYLHFNYSYFGSSYSEAIAFALQHPLETLKVFFVNHSEPPAGDWVKIELYITLLLSGAFAWFLRPHYLLMVIPVIAMKVLNDSLIKWGLNYHYNIELCWLLTFALFEWLGGWTVKTEKRKLTAIAVVIVALGTTLASYSLRRSPWYDATRQNPFIAAHYKRDFSISALNEALELIPKNEKLAVSAHFNIVPRLSIRKDIYEFPLIEDATYIAVLKGEGYYSYYKKTDQKTYDATIDSIMNSTDWETLYDKNKTVILRRLP